MDGDDSNEGVPAPALSAVVDDSNELVLAPVSAAVICVPTAVPSAVVDDSNEGVPAVADDTNEAVPLPIPSVVDEVLLVPSPATQTVEEEGVLPSSTELAASPGVVMEVPEQVEAEDFSSEPLEERFRSKDAKRRACAYTEVQEGMLRGQQDAFVTFEAHLDGCVGEVLPNVQGPALNALLTYLQQCSDGKPDQDFVPGQEAS
jgi:hypothetical protein